MEVQVLEIPDVFVLAPVKFGDERGFFSETFQKKRYAEFGIDVDFVQDNHAYTAKANTVRGLHFQTPPYAQDKLIRVVRGSVFDVAVDIRQGSPYYGCHVAAVISADKWNQIFVPAGFAHGFMTLEDNTEVIYKVSNYYAPEHDKGLYWNDPVIGIGWPAGGETVIVSDKDQKQPLLKDLPGYFAYNNANVIK